MQKGPLQWPGGKSRLRKEVINRIPEHTSYVEPFCGGAWVLFGKAPSEVEVINDVHGELINFFKVVKYRPFEFLRAVDFLPAARRVFGELKELDKYYLDEITRAARFFYLNKEGFAGKMENFGVQVVRKRSFNRETVGEKVFAVSRRLRRVTIESLDFQNCIDVYDRPHTLFYLDPPYFEHGDCFEYDLPEEDHRRLRESLEGIQGRFLLSYNDHPWVRENYAGFNLIPLKTRYSMMRKAAARSKDFRELLIANFEIN